MKTLMEAAIEEKLERMRNIADHYVADVERIEAAHCLMAYTLTANNPAIRATHLIMTSYPTMES